jgi:hypothetical protein
VVNSDTSGYHETLTCFWLAMIAQFFAERRTVHPGEGQATMIQALVDAYGGRGSLFWGILVN